MKKTKLLSLLLISALLLTLLGGCGEGAEISSDKLSIVTTIFPEYDWVREILGDRADSVDLTLLLDKGVDLHSYQPTADDMIKISACDVFIYVGGESDSWVDDALKEARNDKMIVIDLFDLLSERVLPEEELEGMQAEADDEHEHEGGEGEPEYDEHVWLSLKNAAVCVEKIAERLAAADADNADAYRANAAAYIDKLNSLDADYAAAVSSASRRTLLFGDRFPFAYLADDYQLHCYAAFIGCSAETEASFETVIYLADKTDELNLPYILTIEGSNAKIADTIIAATKNKSAEVLSLNSMQSTTKADVEAGEKYHDIMSDNLNVLKQALN